MIQDVNIVTVRNSGCGKQWRIQDFPEEGAPTPRGRQHTILPNFPKKLHEIERIWTPRGVTHPRGCPP